MQGHTGIFYKNSGHTFFELQLTPLDTRRNQFHPRIKD